MTTKTKTAVESLGAVREHAESIRNDEHAIVGDMSTNDAYAQGDVLIVKVSDELPRDWERLEQQPETMQLAPGDTQGSRHIATGPVEIYASDPAAAHDELIGPRLFATGEWCLTHPEHGDRTFQRGAYEVRYQRRMSDEQQRRRALD